MTEARPSQIAAAISPAAIRSRMSGTGMRDDVVDDDLNDQRDQAPDHAVDDVGGMRDRARDRQRKAQQAQAERDGRARLVLADQLEFVVRA